jgi:hypothetical protein
LGANGGRDDHAPCLVYGCSHTISIQSRHVDNAQPRGPGWSHRASLAAKHFSGVKNARTGSRRLQLRVAPGRTARRVKGEMTVT